MPKKILYVINHMDWFWSHRLPLAQGAKKEGWDVHVAATGADTDSNLQAHKFHGHTLPSPEEGFTPFTMLKIIYTLHNILQAEKPDLVHAITLKYAFIAGLAARLHPNISVVHTIAGLGYLFSGEGIKPKLLRILVGPFLKLALKGKKTRLIFQNPDDQALMIKRGFARPEQCSLIRGSGVDLEQFSPKPEPQNTSPVIIMPTRLVHDKGIAVFVEAARILQNRNINAKFQIAGGVTKNNPLAISQEEMEAMVANGAAAWLGKVSDMPALFAGADLVVYPSYYNEGIPKVLLEAAAMAKPIITTDHPGCREVVQHGLNGFLVPVKNAEAVAETIFEILKDEKRLEEMGRQSRLIAEKEFDVRLVVQKTLAVYSFS